jgi:hypothetical protein
MASSIDRQVPVARHITDLPLSGFADTWVQSLVQAQQAHWAALATWQDSFASLNTAAWDAWAAHFAGGVPIDA